MTPSLLVVVVLVLVLDPMFPDLNFQLLTCKIFRGRQDARPTLKLTVVPFGWTFKTVNLKHHFQ